MTWRDVLLPAFVAGLICALGLLGGCTSTADLANVVAQLKGDTATACVSVQGAWGTVTAARVNQNSTTVDAGCKISQGMNMPPTTTVILPASSPPMQVMQIPH